VLLKKKNMTVSLEELARECGVEGDVKLVERVAIVVGGGEYKAVDCERAWNGLTDDEKMYAHYLSSACWVSMPVCGHQVSRESSTLFYIVQKCFRGPRKVNEIVAAIGKDIGSEEVAQRFMEYSAAVLGNLGNYTAYGDSKFVPRLSRKQYIDCVRAAVAGQKDADATVKLAEAKLDDVFLLNPAKLRRLGFDEEGVTSYYTADISKKEAEAVQAVLDRHGENAVNTRCAKVGDKKYRVVAASAEPSADVKTYEEDGIVVEVACGDFATYMARCADQLEMAAKYAPREVEKKMLHEYIEHFRKGDVNLHKESQRTWVTDKNPSVETNIGFIETYRDPMGVRAEWEGWVAIVDKELSRSFASLVDCAPKLLTLLPWGPSFEKPRFIKPDFTAIDVLTYGTAGIPLGINLPNYDDVREGSGFKNVSLSNILRSCAPEGKVNYLSEEDGEFFKKMYGSAWDIGVGIHELLGHGSGRVLVEGSFDPEKIISPITGKPVTSWYKPGQTYDSVFKARASPMEECRAESVSLVLCVEPDVLRCFGHNPDDLHDGCADVTYANYLLMCYSGFSALDTYVAATKKWMQAHSQARFGILTTLMRASREAAARTGKKPAVRFVVSEDRTEVRLEVDRSQVMDVLLPAARDLVCKLQIYRATADAEGGARFWDDITNVDLSDPDLATAYEIIQKNHKPRRLFVQPLTQVDGSSVRLINFPATPVGMIESYQARFPNDDAIDLSCDKIC